LFVSKIVFTFNPSNIFYYLNFLNMGLNKGENAGTIYLSVANGRLVRQHKEATKETVQRENKQGRIVHEEFFKDLTGRITKIATKENDYGKQWQVIIVDGDDKYMVQMPYSGRYSSSFLKALPNVDPAEPVKFMPWEMDDKNRAGKTVTGVTLYQNDGNGWVKIKSAFTKEEPNGLPEMKKVKVKGKETWDDSAMMEHLESVAAEWSANLSEPSNSGTGDAGDLEEAPF
jgi:hypothetical protein